MRVCLLMRLAVLAGTFALAACQAGATPEPAAPSITLYRPAGSRQCEGGGVTPQDVSKELAAARIAVIEVACGTDGRMRAALCGTPDGRLVVIEVARESLQAAQARGFKPLAELPEAGRTACR